MARRKISQARKTEALVSALREGQRDLEEGRVITHEQMRAKWLGRGSSSPDERGRAVIAELRTLFRLSDQQIGQMLGATDSAVQSWSRGASTIPADKLAALAEAEDPIERLAAMFAPEKVPQVIRRQADLFEDDTALEWILQGRIREVADRYGQTLRYQG